MQIGLALGGGGSRGFAHLGVLRAIAERGHEVIAIAGCSMGGIVGAFAAAGIDPEEIERKFLETPFVKLLDRSRGGALMGGKGITAQLAKHLPDTFEELKLPFGVTAVDINLGRPVVLHEGPLLPALRASSAIPGILAPVHHRGHVLIDGGLLNNVPVDVVRTHTMAPIVAVDVTPPAERTLDLREDAGIWERFLEPLSKGRRPLIAELFMKAYEIPQALINEIRLATNPPDLLIRPLLDADLKLEDYDRLEEASEIGYRTALASLDQFPGLRPEA